MVAVHCTTNLCLYTSNILSMNLYLEHLGEVSHLVAVSYNNEVSYNNSC